MDPGSSQILCAGSLSSSQLEFTGLFQTDHTVPWAAGFQEPLELQELGPQAGTTLCSPFCR